MDSSEKRYAFTGIIIENRERNASAVQKILSENAGMILGRMGLPDLDGGGLSIITVILYASTDEIGALTGRLGRIPGVSVKSGISRSR